MCKSNSDRVRHGCLLWAAVTILVTTELWSGDAEALPTLQMFLPDAEYHDSLDIGDDTVTHSWFTGNNPFELVVAAVARPSTVDEVRDLRLWIAIQKDDFESNPQGTVTLHDDDGHVVAPVSNRPVFGTPDPLSPHDAYPAYFFEYQLPSLDVANGRDEIFDFSGSYDQQDPGEPVATGATQRYTVTYTDFFWLHMDLSGIAVDSGSQQEQIWARIAPYSHDADAPGVRNGSSVDEPAGLSLLPFALAALFAWRGRWQRRAESHPRSAG